MLKLKAREGRLDARTVEPDLAPQPAPGRIAPVPTPADPAIDDLAGEAQVLRSARAALARLRGMLPELADAARTGAVPPVETLIDARAALRAIDAALAPVAAHLERPSAILRQRAELADARAALVPNAIELMIRATSESTGATAPGLAGFVRTPVVELPYRYELEAMFGTSLSDVRAHVGEGDRLRGLGGIGAADGNVVAFADPRPDRSTVAHEIVHVLQARADGTGDAEHEAELIEARLAAGHAPGPITARARGIHFKDGDRVVITQLGGPATADQALDYGQIKPLLPNLVRDSGVFERHLYSKHLGASPSALSQALFATRIFMGAGKLWTNTDLAKAVAPDDLETLVNRARRADDWSNHQQAGPLHKVSQLPIAIEIATALARQVDKSITRLLPRYVAKAQVERGLDGVLAARYVPTYGEMLWSHPVDESVAAMLCAPSIKIDAVTFATEHSAEVSTAAAELARVVARKGVVKVKLLAEQGLWHWVETDPADATAEEVAIALYGSGTRAFELIAARPRFGFYTRNGLVPALATEYGKLERKLLPLIPAMTAPKRAEITIIAGPRPAPRNAQEEAIIKVFQAQNADPIEELARAGGDALVLARAKEFVTPGGERHDALNIIDRIDDALSLLPGIQAGIKSFQVGYDSTTVATLRTMFEQRKTTAMSMAKSDLETWYSLVSRQVASLSKVARGLNNARARAAGYGGLIDRGKGMEIDASLLPDSVREPLRAAAGAYEHALIAIAMPEQADARTAEADRLLRTAAITALETTLHQGQPVIENAIDRPAAGHPDATPYDPNKLKTTNDKLLVDLMKLRVQGETDPAGAEREANTVQGQVADLSLELNVVAQLEALDTLWNAVEDDKDFWQSFPDAVAGQYLKDRNRLIYEKFKTFVLIPYRTGSDKQKQAARAYFKYLAVDSGEIKKLMDDVSDQLKKSAKHKRWAKIVVGIVIAIAAMAIGQVTFAALAVEGAGAAVLGAAVVETTVSVTLNKLILNIDPSLGQIITGFLGSSAMYSMMGRAIATAEGAGAAADVAAATQRIGALRKAGTVAVNWTKEMIMVQALGMVQGEVASLIDHGRTLSEDELKEMFTHAIGQFIGMKIGQRLIDVTLDPMKPFRSIAGRHGIDLDGLIAEHKRLQKLAAEQQKAPTTKRAQALVDGEAAFMRRRDDVRARLLDVAAKQPGLAKLDLARLESMAYGGSRREMVGAQAAMALEEIGPGVYRVDQHGFDAMVESNRLDGNHIEGVSTDANGLRTVSIRTKDGAAFTVKERLGAVGDRAAAPVSHELAGQFEAWLSTHSFDTNVAANTAMRERMLELWARDPQRAAHLATQYGFKPSAPLRPLDARAAADRAYEMYRDQHETEPGKPRETGDQPRQTRADFEAMYRAGFEYDPVLGRWVHGGVTRAAGQLRPGAPKDSYVVGEVPSEAVGLELMRMLANGDAHALKVVGVEPPAGFESRIGEWGLGERGGKFFLVRGGLGEVNWGAIGMRGVAHSHPFLDAGFTTPRIKPLTGKDGKGVIDVRNLAGLQATAKHEDLVYLLTSSSDLGYAWTINGPHRVVTPFVHLGEGRVGTPRAGLHADTVDLVITDPRPIGRMGKYPVFRAKIRVFAGEHEIGSFEISQLTHDLGEGFFLGEPHDITPLAPNDPILAGRPQVTQAARPINHAPGTLIDDLIGRGIDPTTNAGYARIITELDIEHVQLLELLLRETAAGRVTGLKEWFDWAVAKGKTGADLVNTLGDYRQAFRILGEDPTAKIQIGGDGTFVQRPGAPTGESLKSFDLVVAGRKGWEVVEVTRGKGSPPAPSDINEGVRHAGEKARDIVDHRGAIPGRVVGVAEIDLPWSDGSKMIDEHGTISRSYKDSTGWHTKTEGNLFDDTPAKLATVKDHALVNELVVTDYNGRVIVRFERTSAGWVKR